VLSYSMVCFSARFLRFSLRKRGNDGFMRFSTLLLSMRGNYASSDSRLCLARLYAGDYKGYVVSEETVAIRRFSTLLLSTRGNYASSDSRLLILFVIRSAQGCAR